MNRIAGRTAITLLLVFLLIAGFAFFVVEYIAGAAGWVVFPGSPHVYNGGNIGCGVITDRNGVMLVNMNGDRVYTTNPYLRMATVHWLGDRGGSVDAPALSGYSTQLAGFSLLNGVYSYGQTGGVAELTLSAQVQVAALTAMGEHKGTVGVYNYKTGELICAISTPTFDPDAPPAIAEGAPNDYEGIYWNRFIQSSYIPGSIFKIVTLAAALETIPDIQKQTFMCYGSYDIGNDSITCETAHREQDIKKAFSNSCNCAFAQVSEQLGKDVLTRYAQQFGITEPVSFDGITTASGNFDLKDASAVSVAWSSIGQYKDLINPCRFMTFVGSIAGGGTGAQPYLVSDITVSGIRNYTAKTQIGERTMTLSTAKTISEYLRNNVESKYGDENFPGLTVCAKTGTGEVGGGRKPNAMITGFVADEKYPFAFIVTVEDGGYGRDVCIPILSQVLAACKEMVDSK